MFAKQCLEWTEGARQWESNLSFTEDFMKAAGNFTERLLWRPFQRAVEDIPKALTTVEAKPLTIK